MKIENNVIWENRSGRNTSWFHPKATALGDNRLVMTMQGIEGSDYYLPVCESFSSDRGVSWSAPRPIPEMGRKEIGHGIVEGVCDVVPEYDAATDTVLAIGHNVYYREGRLFDTMGTWNPAEGEEARRMNLQRYPVYAVRSRNGEWRVSRQRLEVPGMHAMSSYSCGCSQRVQAGGFLYIPLTFGDWEHADRRVMSLRCRFDGHAITVLETGNVLTLPAGRGLMEPSLCLHQGRFMVTLRTEDGFGYYSVSADGLHWGEMIPWTFDTGERLVMTNTQQHWLELGGRLFLIYNRQLSYNRHLMRWRSPLLISEVDPERMVLRRDTEQIVFPMIPEDSDEKFNAALYGNFHPATLNGHEALVLTGEERGFALYYSNTLIARITHEDSYED